MQIWTFVEYSTTILYIVSISNVVNLSTKLADQCICWAPGKKPLEKYQIENIFGIYFAKTANLWDTYPPQQQQSIRERALSWAISVTGCTRAFAELRKLTLIHCSSPFSNGWKHFQKMSSINIKEIYRQSKKPKKKNER